MDLTSRVRFGCYSPLPTRGRACRVERSPASSTILSPISSAGRCDGGTASPRHRAWQLRQAVAGPLLGVVCGALAAHANAIDFGGAPDQLRHYMIGLVWRFDSRRSPSAQRANALMLWILLAVADAADCALDLYIPVSYPTVSHGRTGVGRTRTGQAYGEPCRKHLHIRCSGPSSHPSCRTPSTRH